MAHPECDNSAIAEELWEISMMIYLMCTPEADYRPNDRARVAYALQNIVEDIENKNPNPTDLEQFYLKRIREHVRHIET